MNIKNPPMGWNTWNAFGTNINEDLVLSVADAILETGLKSVGYEYVIIDDGWQNKNRVNGHIVEDFEKFPHGIRFLSDALHAKGLKFGLYSACGVVTCGGYPSSLEHEWEDIETFEKMGIDYLKYDYCFRPRYRGGEQLYRAMGLAISNCKRNIIFSACSWGIDGTTQWIGSTGANTWRSTKDIYDNFKIIKEIVARQPSVLPYGGRGCFNDMDMLVVGMNNNGHVALGGCTPTEYRTHFAIWCILQSPLILGADVRNLDAESLKLLKNKYLLRINQDSAGYQPYFLDNNWDENKEVYTFVRFLSDGEIAIGLFNLADKNMEVVCSFSDIGLNLLSKKGMLLINCFTEEQQISHQGIIKTFMPPHDCVVYIAKVVD